MGDATYWTRRHRAGESAVHNYQEHGDVIAQVGEVFAWMPGKRFKPDF
jgi:hypothetical protein